MLEDDLIEILRNRRVVLNNALEALHQYRNITSQVNKHNIIASSPRYSYVFNVTRTCTYRKMVVKNIREPGYDTTTIHTHII